MTDTHTHCPPSVRDGVSLPMILGRSLFPFASLLIILGTLWWGPWVSLVLTFVWWRIVTRIG